ncbi:hypothetical protein GE09DRAFT_1246921 [Coniochaeta sp. 2T2.1]|nr:hypothetical protein GE09DRAFT_1246921 [Coniochaeta sp. 2T2.1]
MSYSMDHPATGYDAPPHPYFLHDPLGASSSPDDDGRATLGNTVSRLARYIVSYKGDGEATTTMTARSFFFGPESDDDDDDDNDTSDENATHRAATFTESADDVRLFNSINPWRKGIRIVPPTSVEISPPTSARHERTLRWNLYGDLTGRGIVLGEIKVCLQASDRDWLKGLRRQDIANLITVATAVMVEGDKYTWPAGYGRPPVARRADVKYLKGFWIHPIIGGAAVVDDPEFNGIVNGSFERMLRY